MAQPQSCPRCGVLATDREKHRRDHVHVDELEKRITDIERAVEHHHPSVEGRAEVDLREREPARRTRNDEG